MGQFSPPDKQFFSILGNAVKMEALQFATNAALPAANGWANNLDSLLQPYIDGTEEYDSILVVGFTDNTGSKKNNLRLSAKRAANIAAYLTSHGIPENRIHIAALGEAYPSASNNTREGRESNRRVEINFLKSS